jgi:hypothetical protein
MLKKNVEYRRSMKLAKEVKLKSWVSLDVVDI